MYTSHIIGWYSNNFLLCNTAETKVFLFSLKFLNTDPISSINIGANTIKLESTVCDLGVVLDKHFDMSTQVSNICKSASLVMRKIGKIRNCLDQTITEKLVHAFVTSKIDFCNSLLFAGFSKKRLDKLQRILNAASRTTTKTKKVQHISPVLRNLRSPITRSEQLPY